MVSLDNLVVTTALPAIRKDLGAAIEELEWTVNAYTLTFAVFLLTGAALGDRFGRRRMFAVGLAIFTAASAAAALAPTSTRSSPPARCRASAARRPAADADAALRRRPGRRRGAALGAWGASPASASRSARWSAAPSSRALLAVDLLDQRADRDRAGPARAAAPRREPRPANSSTSPASRSSASACSASSGPGPRQRRGWTSPGIVTSFVAGTALLVAFVAWELRATDADAADALLPLPHVRRVEPCRCSCSSACSARSSCSRSTSRSCRAYSPLKAASARCRGRRCRCSSRRSRARSRTGSAAVRSWPGWPPGDRPRLDRRGLEPDVAYASLVPAFVIAGIGMALFFAPVANVVPRRSAAGGGPRLGRQQRHPRDRRRVRRRGARLGVLPHGG